MQDLYFDKVVIKDTRSINAMMDFIEHNQSAVLHIDKLVIPMKSNIQVIDLEQYLLEVLNAYPYMCEYRIDYESFDCGTSPSRFCDKYISVHYRSGYDNCLTAVANENALFFTSDTENNTLIGLTDDNGIYADLFPVLCNMLLDFIDNYNK